MNSQDSVMFFLSQLASAAPYLILYLVTFVVALVLRSRCPRAATCAMIGIAVLFLTTFCGTLLMAYVIQLRQSENVSLTNISTIFSVLAIVRALMDIVGFVLVFAAIFMERKPKESLRQPGQELPPIFR